MYIEYRSSNGSNELNTAKWVQYSPPSPYIIVGDLPVVNDKASVVFSTSQTQKQPKEITKKHVLRLPKVLNPGPGEFLGGLQLALHVFFHHLQLGHHSLLP